ncbi:hypothetical protein SODALDRAFT_352639 [Sodiomyces alkalinus F11]|uniref:Uncharacterized protein n=1 Tax=Sodiomyces alkalinus (strain CBS 110278 / VKM F-3762 / F11) TaxID=1314773 RepID=A0A3N2PMH8_SODAK|nr:hypothetical protein SODALDRAFT_352639 [Sodiomyces alkalinus F11]ROT35727.1 hypothetical protein SODALDRAFT_352639 [Sodiomyces alkalinus F11]
MPTTVTTLEARHTHGSTDLAFSSRDPLPTVPFSSSLPTGGGFPPSPISPELGSIDPSDPTSVSELASSEPSGSSAYGMVNPNSQQQEQQQPVSVDSLECVQRSMSVAVGHGIAPIGGPGTRDSASSHTCNNTRSSHFADDILGDGSPENEDTYPSDPRENNESIRTTTATTKAGRPSPPRPATTTTHHQPPPTSHPDHLPHSSPNPRSPTGNLSDPDDRTELPPPARESPPSRASTSDTSSTRPTPAAESKFAAVTTTRPASFPDSPVVGVSRSHAAHKSLDGESPSTGTKPQYRRTPGTFGSHRIEAVQATRLSAGEHKTKEWTQGQRELILPKSLQHQSPTDERRQPVRSRPPLSFRPPGASVPTGSVRVAPIRSFRSSGSRRSSSFEMISPSIHAGDSSGDDYSYADFNQRDRTLRALEGRPDDDVSQRSPPDSAKRDTSMDGDDTSGDVFMKIAREEAPRRRTDRGFASRGSAADDAPAISRITQSSHRRPLSAAVPSSRQPASPPRVTRRLSDQQEASHAPSRPAEDDVASEIVVRGAPYRGLLREKAASSHPAEESRVSRVSTTGYRASPITPRSFTHQDATTENSSYSRRRTSVTESSGGYRSSTYKQTHLPYGHSRTYNSSPLATRTAEPHRQDLHHDNNHGLEGTESTASTTAPSTVWDELDDLKSRIHRLELTVLDERPPTATNTTVSTSPKRVSGHAATAYGDASSTTSSQRDSQQQPVLQSAVNRSKLLLSPEVSKALETAASDATALVAMMGTAGQPGPISSGASAIGTGATVTDRQLRRRAEAICRSLTELALALTEEAAPSQTRTVTVQANNTPLRDGPTTPTITKNFPSVVTHQRRDSLTNESSASGQNSMPSPRALSKLEERRNSLLNASNLPTLRLASTAGSSAVVTTAAAAEPPSTVARKSSLLIGRTRRAATEEPEEGRRSSMLLRTRRAGTEEPEDGRKTSLLRERRNTNEGDEEEHRFRAPSRAGTELASSRAVSHSYISPSSTETITLASSALPRRRVGSTMLNSSRLATPSTPSALGGRRYLERSTADRDTNNNVADKLPEDRGQRQGSLLTRTASLLRRPNRESHSTSTSASAQAGGYR